MLYFRCLLIVVALVSLSLVNGETQSDVEWLKSQVKVLHDQQHAAWVQQQSTRDELNEKLKTTQDELKDTQAELKTTQEELNIVKKQLEQKLKQEQKDTTLGERNMSQGSTIGLVSFSSHRTGLYQAGSLTEPIPFDIIDFVIGPGYDTATSVFTAPVGGLYFFVAGVCDNNDAMTAYIMVNGVNRRLLDNDNSADCVSASGVIQLQTGDIVSVDLYANQAINCATTGSCYFDGYLLYEQL